MSPPITEEVRELGQILWDYHRFASPLEKSDLLLVLGSHDTGVAEHAAQLWRRQWAPQIVISGGRGKVTGGWAETEARTFARVAMRLGVPENAILLEETATNTGENITATRSLLAASSIVIDRAILVAKPYMCRRALATAQRQWPGPRWLVSSPDITFRDYPSERTPELQLLELMVGDLQRVKVYAERGFQVPMDIPQPVWDAYRRLVALGFDRYVISD